MKSNYLKFATTTLLVSLMAMGIAVAQTESLQYFRQNDQRGINVFETPKENDVEFDKLKVGIGGAFALQFQGLSHENSLDNLKELGKNFNLATANLDLNAQLHNGVRLHMRTFLSSRHHTETYVKDGYLQIDRLDFIRDGFLGGVMDKVTIKIGHMEINYGDTHFRRSDNAHALYNPFVGNYLLDSYTTEVAGEVYFQSNGLVAMVALSNGRLNQSVLNTDTKPAFYGKIGYDKQISEDLRFRLMGSLYTTSNTNTSYLYSGDRAGARYYRVMEDTLATADDFRSGRVNPAMNTQMTSIMINPFLKYKGLEFFGVFETISGRNEGLENDGPDASFSGNRNWTQLGAELIYRFGPEEKVFIGGRYNSAAGQLPGQETDKVKVNRVNIGGGWFMTKNILAKAEYVSQSYVDFPTGNKFNEGRFNGVMLEAVIAF